LFETRREGTEAFSSASGRGSVLSSWWIELGLTQDDRDVLVGIFVGDVVQGACSVDCEDARVCGPGDSVVLVDDHVFALVLQHAHQVSGAVDGDAAGTDGACRVRAEAQGLPDEGRLSHADTANDCNVDFVLGVVVGLQQAVGTGFCVNAQARARVRRCRRQRSLPWLLLLLLLLVVCMFRRGVGRRVGARQDAWSRRREGHTQARLVCC
jgi:hypothetical protein